MALITEGFEVTITLIDNGKGVSTLTYVCDPAVVTTFAEAQTARDNAVSALADVTQGTIVRTSVKEKQFEDNIVYPGSNVEIENKGSVTVQLYQSPDKGNFTLPTISPAMFVGTSGQAADQIDVTNPFMTAYADLFRHTTGEFFIEKNQKIADSPNGNGIVVGKRISAKNNNG
ncbi:MAG: hypothetical protein MJA83_11035 [Gammaproteobacteria bacterium]|nr:hypothetical protein [Gammaproteobacteria bacterium]